MIFYSLIIRYGLVRVFVCVFGTIFDSSTLIIVLQMFSGGIRSETARQRIDMSGYLSLYTPALDWMMEALADRASDVLLDEILMQCQEKKNK